MGLEFISRTEKTLHRSWDQAFRRLSSAGLLAPSVEKEPSSILFDVVDGCALVEGEQVLVRTDSTVLVAVRGIERIAVAVSAPEAMVVAVLRLGAAYGTVMKVNRLSGTAEVVLGAGSIR